MLQRTCTICGKLHPVGARCPQAKQRHQEYDKQARNRNTAAIYHDPRWLSVRNLTIATYGGLDLVMLRKHKLMLATLVHHIIPVEDDPNRAFDVANLIPVSSKTHAKIHKIYNSGEKNKKNLQNFLFALLKGEGDYENCF